MEDLQNFNFIIFSVALLIVKSAYPEYKSLSYPYRPWVNNRSDHSLINPDSFGGISCFCRCNQGKKLVFHAARLTSKYWSKNQQAFYCSFLNIAFNYCYKIG